MKEVAIDTILQMMDNVIDKGKSSEQTPHIPIRPNSYPWHRVGRSGIARHINHLYGQYQQPDGKEH
jgi:hypothetical protein